MNHSAYLAKQQSRHANARAMGYPAGRPLNAVSLDQLTRLDWAAGNNQHTIHNTSLTPMSAANARVFFDGEYSPNFATWNMFISRVV